jgi:hypothetical protein
MEVINNVNYDVWIHDITGVNVYIVDWYDLIEERIGKIKRMDIVDEEWIEGQKAKALRVKFEYLYNNTYNEDMRIRINLKKCGKFYYNTWIHGNQYEHSLPIYIANEGTYDFEEEGEKPDVVKYVIGHRNIYYTKNTKIQK